MIVGKSRFNRKSSSGLFFFSCFFQRERKNHYILIQSYSKVIFGGLGSILIQEFIFLAPRIHLSSAAILCTKSTSYFVILPLDIIILYMEAGTNNLIHRKVGVKSTKVWWVSASFPSRMYFSCESTTCEGTQAVPACTCGR